MRAPRSRWIGLRSSPRRAVLFAALACGVAACHLALAGAGRPPAPLVERVDLVPALPRQAPATATLWRVEFAGRVPSTIASELGALGGRLLEIADLGGVVARLDAGAARTIRRRAAVTSVTALAPAAKVSPLLGRLPYLMPDSPAARAELDPVVYARAAVERSGGAERARVEVVRVAIRLARDADAGAALMRLIGAGLDPLDEPIIDTEALKMVFGRVDLVARDRDTGIGPLEAIARDDDVVWIDEQMPWAFTFSAESQELLQSGDVDLGRPYWDAGLRGGGEIVGLSDSGLDLDTTPIADTTADAGTPGPSHRKVLDYTPYGGGGTTTCSGYSHGTNTTQNAAGNRAALGFDDETDGVAPDARVVFADIGSSSAFACAFGSVSPPGNLQPLFQDHFDLGARLHSDSWGSSVTAYGGHAQQIDAFLWDHRSFMIFWPTGNSGNNGVRDPGTMKNGVSVGGNLQDPNQTTRWGSSSGGNVPNGRINPQVMAPASDSTGVSGNPAPNDYDTSVYWQNDDGDIIGPPDDRLRQGFGGTSFSSPMAMGAGALAREYFADGFYPSGAANPADARAPDQISGALVKAILINSGRFMDCGNCGGSRPNDRQGTGYIDLSATLPLAGNAQTVPSLFVEDRGTGVGLTTGEVFTATVDVVSGTHPLRVTLVWVDRPGSALTNDLRLRVIAPDGTSYLGNNFQDAWSITEAAGGTTEDVTNVFETVMISPAEVVSGTYTLEVTGVSVPDGDPALGNSQPFALVAAGEFGVVAPGEVSGLVHTVLDADTQRLGWNAVSGDGVTYNVYRGTLASVAGGVFDHDPAPGGCGLGSLSLDLSDLGDGVDHYYLVSATNSAGEGTLGRQSSGADRPPAAAPCP